MTMMMMIAITDCTSRHFCLFSLRAESLSAIIAYLTCKLIIAIIIGMITAEVVFCSPAAKSSTDVAGNTLAGLVTTK